MNRQFLRRSKYGNLKGFLSSMLTMMLILQIFSPGVFAVGSVFAQQPENPGQQGEDNGSAGDTVNICHRDGQSGNWNAITVNENAVNGHIGSHHQDDMDYVVSDEDLGENEFTDEYCQSNAPEEPEEDLATLTVTKVVVGGEMDVDDFPLFINGLSITSGVATTTLSEGNYTVTETGNDDYDASFSGDCNPSGMVHLDEGEEAECTITNTFVGGQGGEGEGTATLTVTKVVVGGEMDVDDFPLFLNGMSITSGISTTTSMGTSTVTETSDDDYTATFSGDCNEDGEVHLGKGQNKSCTLTNTFNGTTSPFMVKIYKYLDGVQANATTSGGYEFPMESSWDWSGDSGTGNYYLGLIGHGGSEPYQAFTSPMTGPADYSTFEITNNIASSSNVLPIDATCEEGMFRLLGYKTGTTYAGALAASLSTTSPSFTDINSERYVIVMNETCEDDEVPVPNATGTIIINKVVINDNGGTGTTSDFMFQVNGTSTTAFEVDGSNSFVVATGTHSVTEVAAAGYAISYESCSDIVVEEGEAYVCTITNNDIPPLQCPVTNGYIESDTGTTIQGGGDAVLLSFVHPGWTADVDGASTSAKWIWSTDPAADPGATTTVTFNRTFTVNGSSTDATLNIASDNTYKIWINSNLVGSEMVDGNNFTLETQDSFDVSNYLIDGVNTLTIEVTNMAVEGEIDPAANPAGLLYSLSWEADDCPPQEVGTGGDPQNGSTNTSSNSSSGGGGSRTIVRGITDSDDDDVQGQVLGITTFSPTTPLGQVLGVASALPGLPYTGLGDILDESNRGSSLPIIAIGLLALGGLYLVQYRIRKAR